jgi:hypothetical protein
MRGIMSLAAVILILGMLYLLFNYPKKMAVVAAVCVGLFVAFAAIVVVIDIRDASKPHAGVQPYKYIVATPSRNTVSDQSDGLATQENVLTNGEPDLRKSIAVTKKGTPAANRPFSEAVKDMRPCWGAPDCDEETKRAWYARPDGY